MDVPKMTDGQRSILMRLYASKLEDFQYKAEFVDEAEAELLVELGLIMLHPTPFLTERGEWAWERYCQQYSRDWRRPKFRRREFDVVNKSRRRKRERARRGLIRRS